MAYHYRGTEKLNLDVPERDARDRILEAAVELYGEYGFDTVTLKHIAQRANVSAPLVIHHFGSSAGLRQACDRYVAEQHRKTKTEAVHMSGPMPRNYALEIFQAHRHLLKYFLRAFAAGGPEMDALFDKLVDDSLEYTAEAEALGLVYPSAEPRRRAVIMLLQAFGSLILHRQMKRHLGASPVDDSPESIAPYMEAVLELYTQPVLNAEMYEELMHSQNQHTHTEGTSS